MSKVAIIGAGFSGLSAAAYAAKAGAEVHVFERHGIAGGRARQFKTENGFVYDMGPSWYWMPDIMERFFADFGSGTADFYELISLNPQFQMVFKEQKFSIPESYQELEALFESVEKGSAAQLRKFMEAARFKYEVSMKDFVQKPSHSFLEFAAISLLKSATKLDLFTNFRSYVKKFFKNEKLQALMEFPVIFLGASPKDIPAMYSLMNYGGLGKGTFYPQGGMYELVKAMHKVAEDQGAVFHFNETVEEITTDGVSAVSIISNGSVHKFDVLISTADYSHTENLLPAKDRNYRNSFWEKQTFAPSSLIYYLGFDRKIPELLHHSLFFQEDLDAHLDTVYKNKSWPEKPLFYVCCPSKTDPSVAPEGMENIFLLMPLAIGINDEEALREKYLDLMLGKLEKFTGVENLKQHLVYKRSYCVSDFRADYSSYGGNAYGLANTLTQTAFLKPKMKNKKLDNLFYAGQLTVPGPGVPPCLISGKIAAQEALKYLQNETVV